MLRAVLQRAVLARAAAGMAMGHAALLISLAELFCIALCIPSCMYSIVQTRPLTNQLPAHSTSETPLTTLKDLPCGAFPRIASEKRVGEQPPRWPYWRP